MTFHVIVTVHWLVLLGAGDYQRIRVVNFIRRSVVAGQSVAAVIAAVQDASSPFWEDNDMLTPVIENDPMLYSLGEAEDDEADIAEAVGGMAVSGS